MSASGQSIVGKNGCLPTSSIFGSLISNMIFCSNQLIGQWFEQKIEAGLSIRPAVRLFAARCEGDGRYRRG